MQVSIQLLVALVPSDTSSGSSFEFAVSNTSIVGLVLSNSALRMPSDADFSRGPVSLPPLLLTPTQKKNERAGPVDLWVALNDTRFSLHKQVLVTSVLAKDLPYTSQHHFRVSLPVGKTPVALQLRGIVIGEYGVFVDRTTKAVRTSKQYNNSHIDSTDYSLPSTSTRNTMHKLVEIVAPSSLLHEACHWDNIKNNNCSVSAAWPHLVDNHFASTNLSIIPVSDSTCITRECQTYRKKITATTTTAQEVFFRAGPPGTHLYNRLWKFESNRNEPAGLVLMLGLADVETFLKNGSLGKHQVTQFTDDFARTYSSFIQTIRRTAYSPASMVDTRSFGQASLQDDIDESYLYNSSPSTIPIFLILQPIPSPLLHPQSRQLKSILHHATAKVLNELKWHIGDKHTFIIDTDG